MGVFRANITSDSDIVITIGQRSISVWNIIGRFRHQIRNFLSGTDWCTDKITDGNKLIIRNIKISLVSFALLAHLLVKQHKKSKHNKLNSYQCIMCVILRHNNNAWLWLGTFGAQSELIFKVTHGLTEWLMDTCKILNSTYRNLAKTFGKVT